MSECLLLFSGGTDSTAAAAIVARQHSVVHLLTCWELGTRSSPMPTENVRRLREKLSESKFTHVSINTDALIRRLSYTDSWRGYLRSLLTHGLFNLATPGMSSLSWHLAAIHHAQELRAQGQKITHVYDGMTRELLHLPGHMPSIRQLFKALYADHDLEFSSPVIDFDIPPDQRFTDRLIVDRHGFAARPELTQATRSTGRLLQELGVFPHANVKGSLFDHRMQHDCYPFVLYNMLCFWWWSKLMPWPKIEAKLCRLFAERVANGREILRSNNAAATHKTSSIFATPQSLS
jgi:hypothetical protein